MTPRATPLSPHDRRAAILAAVVPLVIERGPAVTTRELATAAGVAEGTLFRVFESKDELVLAAARSVLAETGHLDALAAIDPRWPLEVKLHDIARIWQARVRRIIGVYLAFGAAGDRERLGDPRRAIDPEVVAESERIIAGLLGPDADALRLPVPEVIRIIGGLVMMTVHPGEVGVPLNPADLVDLLLHGVAAARGPESMTLPADPDHHGASRPTPGPEAGSSAPARPP